MKNTKTIWQIACEREHEQGGGMRYIMDFLMCVHPLTDEARADLREAWMRYDEEMKGCRYPMCPPNYRVTDPFIA